MMNSSTFETSLQNCYQEMVRFARSLTRSPMAADDLLQDSLIRAWRGRKRIEDPDKFRVWLFTIIRNTFRSQRRRHWWKRMTGLEAATLLPAETGLPYEEKELVRMALQTLPPIQREAVILFEVVGLSIAEITQVQHAGESAVKSRLSRGRQRLRRAYLRLNDQGDQSCQEQQKMRLETD
jgi:RNA polymerase sigma-70 factor (ECF subfamily)